MHAHRPPSRRSPGAAQAHSAGRSRPAECNRSFPTPMSDSDDCDESAPQVDAFDTMMRASKLQAASEKAVESNDDDPLYIAVVYERRLVHIPDTDPLHGIVYIGQAVRSADKYATPEDVAKARWYEENRQAKTDGKDSGLLAALDMYGEDAFENTVLEDFRARLSLSQEWADKREVELIAKYGGPLRSMTKCLKQTLNQTKGGKGTLSWESKDAFRQMRFERFKKEMEEYAGCYGTSLVPRGYVSSVTGYKLGEHLRCFRQGQLRYGMSNRQEIENWVESLPEWAWNPVESDAWKRINSERAKKQFESKEARAALSERGKKQWEEASEETREAWKAAIQEACNDPNYLASLKERSKDQWSNASKETRNAWTSKHRATNKAKSINRISNMPLEEQSAAWKQYEQNQRMIELRKQDLELLRSLGGKWANARREDLEAARNAGLIPTRVAERKPESEERMKSRIGKATATRAAKYKARLAAMKPEDRKKAEATQQRLRRHRENLANHLALLKLVDPKYANDKIEDWNLGNIQKLLKAIGKKQSKERVIKYATEESSEDEELDESVVGSSSDAPPPKRIRRVP